MKVFDKTKLYQDDLCDFCDCESEWDFEIVIFRKVTHSPGLQDSEDGSESQSRTVSYSVCDDCWEMVKRYELSDSLNHLDSIVTRSLYRLMEEIRQDPIALSRLKTKQAYEKMSGFAVLKEFGDPREWAT